FIPVRKFIDHASFAEGIGAFVDVLVQRTDLAGIGAVEGAYRGDLAVGHARCHFDLGHGSPRYLLSSNNYLTLASIFSRLGSLERGFTKKEKGPGPRPAGGRKMGPQGADHDDPAAQQRARRAAGPPQQLCLGAADIWRIAAESDVMVPRDQE